ncbi:MAG: cation diffusion facilitator family transporter [Nitrospirota bacterium]|nr:cation diffusion facilitator family transporter [Nitrospirota bacterium]
MGRDISIDNSGQVKRVLVLTLILNSLVAAAKISFGYFTQSISITSDGFHSMFDGVSNIIGLIGIWIASHPPDKEHPYGHRKFETLFTIAISFMIFVTSFQILKKVFFSFETGHKTVVTTASFMVMLITMGVNIFVAKYEAGKGRELKSDFLLADAAHTKSDIMASIAVIAGLILIKAGFKAADSIAGLVIAVFIAKIGYNILKNATNTLVDTVCLNTFIIESLVLNVNGVRGCNNIRTRGSENSIYLDMRVLVAPDMTTQEAHDISEHIEQMIRKEFPSVVDVIVHIEPEKNHPDHKNYD